MAYEFARIGTAAGARLTDLWDGIIINNAKWSVKDAAAGANAKTYRCLDAGNNVDFCVYVDDNQADFSIIEIWEDWNAGAHVGVGASLTDVSANVFRVYASQGVHVMVSDHRVLLGGSVGAQGYYIGQPTRFDVTKNMPFYIGSTDGGSHYGTLGRYELSTQIAWRTLWDHSGNVDRQIRPYAYNSAQKFARTCRGTYVFEEIVVYEEIGKVCQGYLEGVAHFYLTPNGFFNGEIITCEDGDWLMQGGTDTTKYWSGLRLQ
jgi:hypothetical protein